MAGLLYKEFLVNRRNLIPVGGSLLLISVLMFIKAPDGFEIFYSFMGIFVYLLIFFLTGEMLQASVFEPDETKRWANFILSSPLGAAGQVKSKLCF
jgi:hypothetical protein